MKGTASKTGHLPISPRNFCSCCWSIFAKLCCNQQQWQRQADTAAVIHQEGGGAGKAGGFLALDWQDGGATGPLGRLSFKLHQELADSLGQDIGYRRVQTLSAAAAPTKKGHYQANPLLSELTQCGTHSLHWKWQMKQAKAAAGIVRSLRNSCAVALKHSVCCTCYSVDMFWFWHGTV